MAETYSFDTMGDAGVTTPPRSAMPLAMGILIICALAGLYLGLSAGDHRTRLPGDTRAAGEEAGADFSRARVAVAIAPEDVAPPPPAPEPVVEAKIQETATAAPVVRAPAPAPVEAPPPATAVAPAPPPNLEGLF